MPKFYSKYSINVCKKTLFWYKIQLFNIVFSIFCCYTKYGSDPNCTYALQKIIVQLCSLQFFSNVDFSLCTCMHIRAFLHKLYLYNHGLKMLL